MNIEKIINSIVKAVENGEHVFIKQKETDKEESKTTIHDYMIRSIWGPIDNPYIEWKIPGENCSDCIGLRYFLDKYSNEYLERETIAVETYNDYYKKLQTIF